MCGIWHYTISNGSVPISIENNVSNSVAAHILDVLLFAVNAMGISLMFLLYALEFLVNVLHGIVSSG